MKKNSLAVQLIFFIIVLTIVLIVAQSTISIVTSNQFQQGQADNFISVLEIEQKRQEKLLLDALFMKASAIVNLLSKSSIEPISAFDFEMLERMVSETLSDNDIVNVVFFDADKNIIAGQQKKIEKNTKEIFQEIKSEDLGTVGFILLNLDLSSVQDNVALLDERIHNLIDETKSSIFDGKKQILLRVVLVSFLSLFIFSVLIFWGIKRLVITPITTITKLLKEIAKGEGDLSKRLEIKAVFELERISFWFNEIIANIQNIINHMKKTAGDLSTASNDLTTVANQMGSQAELTLEKSQTASISADSMRNSMGQIAESTHESAESVSQVTQSIEKIAKAIEGIGKNTELSSDLSQDGVNIAKTASEKINQLGAAVKNIGKVTETISEISNQTNLLALNATIEAARAGEAGKGFAVVANEIKNLSSKTENATEKIKAWVSDIESSEKQAVEQILHVSQSAEEINEIEKSSAESVNKNVHISKRIAENITQISQGLSDVNSNMQQGNQLTTMIADDVDQVNVAAEKMNSINKTITNNAEALHKLSSELLKIVNQFAS